MIGESQLAYIEGRNILDGPLIINEVCSWAKKTKKELLLFKLDFDIAFDSINYKPGVSGLGSHANGLQD